MNAIATIPTERKSLVTKFAERFGVDGDKLLHTLKATCFKTKEAASNEQMMALLVVADQYKLNPFTKEIFAFEDKHKGIVPVVSVDGWTRIINEHPTYDGIEFTYADKTATMAGGKVCPEWCEARIYRKDRTRPTIVREYLDEVYQPPRGGLSGPWQSHTKRFLRHKTLIQCARVAFGFAGIYDEDEAHRIIQGESARVHIVERPQLSTLEAKLIERAALEHAPADDVEAESVAELQFDPDTGELLPPELQG
jgi:phage recombination protein Bet